MKKLSNTEAELQNSIAYKRKRVAPFKNTYLRQTAPASLCSKNCSTFSYFRPKFLIKNYCLFFFLKKKHENFKWIIANKLRKSLLRKNIVVRIFKHVLLFSDKFVYDINHIPWSLSLVKGRDRKKNPTYLHNTFECMLAKQDLDSQVFHRKFAKYPREKSGVVFIYITHWRLDRRCFPGSVSKFLAFTLLPRITTSRRTWFRRAYYHP